MKNLTLDMFYIVFTFPAILSVFENNFRTILLFYRRKEEVANVKAINATNLVTYKRL